MSSEKNKDFAERENKLAKEFLLFINKCASQFHAVEEVSRQLADAGFIQISEKNDNDFANIKPNGRYFFTRNQSTVIAFAVGSKYKAGNGFTIAAAHTDSPVLKIKPISKSNRHGFVQIGVEPYGGGLWYTWFDRDLSIAGRVIVADDDGLFHSKLVRIDQPLLRIPSLAIHLNREVNEKGFQFNLQTNVVPILSTQIKAELEAAVKKAPEEKIDELLADSHTPKLYDVLAEKLKVKPSKIKHIELCLYDTQPAALVGAYEEFICSRALDNLMMSFISMKSLLDSSNNKSLENEENIRMIALFDNEEVGSDSYMGAGSNLMSSLLRRIVGDSTRYDSAIAKSFLISADMAHALHPNFADKHEDCHKPVIHQGLVIKQNANQRYATSSISSFLISEIAKRNGIPIQRFVARNDMGCGSTIGPILASSCGIRTVDVGVAQLSMHSIREMCGTADVLHSYELIRAFFHEFPQLDKSLSVDK